MKCKCGIELDYTTKGVCPICGPLSSHAMLADVRAVVVRKFIKGIALNNSVSGNKKRLAVIVECELIDDLPESMIGKTIKISEHFS